MLQPSLALTQIRNLLGAQSGRGPAFWVATALIALLVPSPIAAPVLLARFRRPSRPNQE
jgi:hypothetical protein